MPVLILGSGAREHALAARLAAEPAPPRIVCAPGNAGMVRIAKVAPVALDSPDAMLALAEREQVTLTIVGPELPLSVGVVDRFMAAGRPILGPTQAAARLETSKGWAKQFMARHRVPTARFEVAETEERALGLIATGSLGWPLVVKADGLAAGKGVVVADDAREATLAVIGMMRDGRFGEAGARLVLEECLTGTELSYFVLTDGRSAMALGTAQDHKRALDGDRGPNTGGMGAFAPSPLMDAELDEQIRREVVLPTLAGMRAEGHPYRGFLYCGLMLTASGPKVIEFNARLGDPEAQVILPLLDEPLLPLIDAAAAGALPDRPATLRHEARVGVVMVSGGYPDTFEAGRHILGLDVASALPGVDVYHASTSVQDGEVVTSGGRVLTVVGRGADYETAIQRAYAGVDAITFEGAFARRDIGATALKG